MIISECHTHSVRPGSAGDRIGKEKEMSVYTYTKIITFLGVDLQLTATFAGVVIII
jgi:hypothetical protein